MNSLRRRCGFTLIEMLVVIGIMMVLISLVVVAMGMVRRQANKAQCGSNLRILSQAMLFYAVDNRGYVPGPDMKECQDYYWWQSLARYEVDMYSSIYVCPDGNFEINELRALRQGNVISASVYNPWGHTPVNLSDYETVFHCNSYGVSGKSFAGEIHRVPSTAPPSWVSINGWTYAQAVTEVNAGRLAFTSKTLMSTRIPKADQLVYMGDKQAIANNLGAGIFPCSAGPQLDDPTNQANAFGGYANVIQYTSKPVYFGELPRATHQRRANFVFFDGHVAAFDPVALCPNGFNAPNSYTGRFSP